MQWETAEVDPMAGSFHLFERWSIAFGGVGFDIFLAVVVRDALACQGALFVEGVGHSSHVTNVKWTVDDKYLLTAGGNDKSLLQWQVLPPAK